MSARLNDTEACDPKERGQQQRERILCAAKRCFIDNGFHAASMANIAETAGISAGLIYRYFDSKSAIVQAIIEGQLVERQEGIASLQTERHLADRLQELYRSWRDGDPSVMNAALFLEMSAEATRDKQIASALTKADRTCGDQFLAWMRERAGSKPEAVDERSLRVRELVLLAFIEGLAVRAVRERGDDADLVADAIRCVTETLLDVDSRSAA
ncbi:MAG: helix-turn-helix domain-containing protein [Lysobacteraceae bacterium]